MKKDRKVENSILSYTEEIADWFKISNSLSANIKYFGNCEMFVKVEMFKKKSFIYLKKSFGFIAITIISRET
jgi:hypothetical protein